jgi:2,3-bisphosphoglycerate-dependent phosphoglycerate mutase
MRFVAVLLIFALPACTPSIYVVRHAEKDLSQSGANMMTADPPLSKKGVEQSKKLAAYLRGKRIRHVFFTSYQRSKHTALPLLERDTRIQSSVYSPKSDSLSKFLESVRATRGSVLIVAHSNTIGPVVNGLLGKNKWMQTIGEQEHTWIVRIRRTADMPFDVRKYAAE